MALLFHAWHFSRHRYGDAALALAGNLTAASGFIALAGYLSGVTTAHSWGDYSGMSLLTACCFTLLGAGITAAAWRRAGETPFWAPLPVAAGFLVAALAVWQAVKGHEDIVFEKALQQQADAIAARGTESLAAFYASIDRIAERWMKAGGTARALWEDDAQNYLKGYPYLRALQWLDKDAVLRWGVPVGAGTLPAGIKLNDDGTRAETMERARLLRTPQVTQVVTLRQGGSGTVSMSPLFVREKFDGMIVLDPGRMMEQILQRDHRGPYSVTLGDARGVFFSTLPAGAVLPERWQRSAVMKNRGDLWTVTVAAGPDMLVQRHSPLSGLVLLAGLVCALFATLAAFFKLRSRRDARDLRLSGARLQQIIQAHALPAAEDFDLKSFMHDIVARVPQLTAATGAAIELADKDEMVCHAASGSAAAFMGFRLKREGSLPANARRSGAR